MNCSTVPSISWAGDVPGLPRTPNAPANCSSAYTSPNTSRIRIARLPLRDDARAVRAVNSGTSGQGLGCIDMTSTSLRPQDGEDATAPRSFTAQTWKSPTMPGVSRISHQGLAADQNEPQTPGHAATPNRIPAAHAA